MEKKETHIQLNINTLQSTWIMPYITLFPIISLTLPPMNELHYHSSSKGKKGLTKESVTISCIHILHYSAPRADPMCKKGQFKKLSPTLHLCQ